jgi:hypothetical protein
VGNHLSSHATVLAWVEEVPAVGKKQRQGDAGGEGVGEPRSPAYYIGQASFHNDDRGKAPHSPESLESNMHARLQAIHLDLVCLHDQSIPFSFSPSFFPFALPVYSICFPSIFPSLLFHFPSMPFPFPSHPFSFPFHTRLSMLQYARSNLPIDRYIYMLFRATPTAKREIVTRTAHHGSRSLLGETSGPF